MTKEEIIALVDEAIDKKLSKVKKSGPAEESAEVKELIAHMNRHKGGPSPKRYTVSELDALQTQMDEARKNAAPPTV